jgi:hypothetical protein
MRLLKLPERPGIAVLLACAWMCVPANAQETDLSCMSYRVLDKIQVAERYKEFDVIVENSCPGPVYWTMCIERLDSGNQRILESHTPGGYVEQDSKSRVNLQMKKSGEPTDFRQRFQEFYVNVAYGIAGPSSANCVAGQCEARKREARADFRGNLAAWEKAEKALASRLEADCPESGWGVTEEVETCRAAIRESAQPAMDAFARKDTELRQLIVADDNAAYCRLYGGDLVPN